MMELRWRMELSFGSDFLESHLPKEEVARHCLGAGHLSPKMVASQKLQAAIGRRISILFKKDNPHTHNCSADCEIYYSS